MNFEKFIKLMMMTTSPADNEALTALRLANAELASTNKNWEEVLRGKVKVEHGQVNQNSSDVNHTDADEINALFELAFAKVSRHNSFYEWLENVHTWWEDHGFLTPRQYEVLARTAGR